MPPYIFTFGQTHAQHKLLYDIYYYHILLFHNYTCRMFCRLGFNRNTGTYAHMMCVCVLGQPALKYAEKVSVCVSGRDCICQQNMSTSCTSCVKLCVTEAWEKVVRTNQNFE